MDLHDFTQLKEKGKGFDFWWFKGKNDLIKIIIKNLGSHNNKVLNVGCGIGEDLGILSQYTDLYMLDISKKTLDVIPDSIKGKKILGDALEIPFKKNFFEGVVTFDLLEHIKDDKRVIDEIYRVLKTKGYVFMTVPAIPFLYSTHDKVLKHHRRYSKKMVYNLVNNKFKIIRITYWNFFLFLPTAVLRLIKKIIHFGNPHSTPTSDLKNLPSSINILLTKIIKFENRLIKKGINLPIGTSFVVILQKRK